MATLTGSRRLLAAGTLLLGSAVAATPAADVARSTDPSAQMGDAATAFERGDVTAAMTALRPLAEAGYVPAQVRLAYYLDYAEDDSTAFHWYATAAAAGDAEAQFYLAKLYGAGEGTATDTAAALDWYVRAADQGYLPAIRVLAMSYEQGGPLAPISYEAAVTWLEAGAALDDEWSLRRLSAALSRGELGLRVNRDRANALAARADAHGRRADPPADQLADHPAEQLAAKTGDSRD